MKNPKIKFPVYDGRILWPATVHWMVHLLNQWLVKYMCESVSETERPTGQLVQPN